MKLIYTSENRLLVSNAKNILENAGISAILKNEFASGGLGDLAALDTWLEVWVANDEDYDQAVETLKSTLSTKNATEWVCTNCREVNAASFDFCWNCEKENI
jgi:hypothetical protein